MKIIERDCLNKLIGVIGTPDIKELGVVVNLSFCLNLKNI